MVLGVSIGWPLRWIVASTLREQCPLDIFAIWISFPRSVILEMEDWIWLLDWAYAGGFPETFECFMETKTDVRWCVRTTRPQRVR